MRKLKLIAAVAAFALASAAANAKTIEMTVYGLVCGFCAQGIAKRLRKIPATADVLVSLEHRLVAIATKEGADIDDAELRAALTNAVYDVKAIARTDNSLDALRSKLKAAQ